MTHSSRRGRKIFLAGGLAAALAVGVSATTVTAAPTPAPATKPVACPTTPGVDNASINVGIITPTTGPAVSSFTGFVEGAKLRIAQQNAKGGVNGRKINITVYDDKADGGTQSSVANKAIQQDNVFGIIEASTVDTMMAIFKAQNVPVVGLANLPAHGTDRNVFGATGAFAPLYGNTGAFARLKAAGATKVAVVNHNSPGAQAGGAAAVTGIPLEGMTLALRIADAPIGTFDATSVALRIKNSGADAEYSILTSDGGIAVANALKQQGVPMKAIMLAGFSDPRVIAQAPAALEGAIGTTFGTVPTSVPGRPGVRTFANGMRAAGLNPDSVSGPIGFVSADTFIKGLTLAGKCPTRAGFIDNLRKQTKITGAGLLPEPISYAPGVTPNGDPARCGWYLLVKDGKFVPDAKATCGKLVETATGRVVG
ncbi:MAG: ABC transporter substrate-binding protein [Actinomycetota bacterium]|nr:ABC transporter substrate-binding protein [Actinomycetota bacterium]MDP2288031.1 ABC transporter substrate-binding protein [Actinomycetota bacterium]